MKIKNQLLTAAAVSALAMSSSVFAATGGGATIHNAANLTFSGGQVTAHVNVKVRTIGTQPTILLDSATSTNGGESVVVNYTITSNSNGSDNYNLTVTTTDVGVSAPSNLLLSPNPITLGASIALGSTNSASVLIPAGSELNLTAGDIVNLDIGGGYLYTIASIVVGTPASTSGNTTTPETYTEVFLTPVVGSGAPVIDDSNVPAGTVLGEQKAFTVSLDAGDPLVPGIDGTHQINIGGNTTALNPTDVTEPIVYTDPTPAITVLSGSATLIKEVRNETQAGAFATSGVTGKTGDVLEYRLTAGTIATLDVGGATLKDSIPQYSSYVAGSTTLNGVNVPDPSLGVSAIEGAGMAVNSLSGAPGEIKNGETAVVIFQVIID